MNRRRLLPAPNAPVGAPPALAEVEQNIVVGETAEGTPFANAFQTVLQQIGNTDYEYAISSYFRMLVALSILDWSCYSCYIGSAIGRQLCC